MAKLNIQFENSRNQDNATDIQAMRFADSVNADHTIIKANFVSKVKGLWRDKGIQSCFDRRAEFQLNDGVKYFLDNFDKILNANYLPTTEDILHTPFDHASGEVEAMDISLSPDPNTLRFLDPRWMKRSGG
jgi:hypothetical protein